MLQSIFRSASRRAALLSRFFVCTNGPGYFQEKEQISLPYSILRFVRGPSYNAPTVEVNAIFADASDRDAISVAATIANQLQMAWLVFRLRIGDLTQRKRAGNLITARFPENPGC